NFLKSNEPFKKIVGRNSFRVKYFFLRSLKKVCSGKIILGAGNFLKSNEPFKNIVGEMVLE
ncbi:hypothetical protein LPB90_18580, partial [Chryseobacterium sp. LC2016-29]|uniref:hypothetical protein n=1 Tax=Chryseobacterium sp. LC2016-29 TaxID=2897331 RepID=UPI001E443C91